MALEGPDASPEGRRRQLLQVGIGLISYLASGRALDLLALDPADLMLDEIAHGLAGSRRFHGQSAVSVAQHSCLVARDLLPDLGLARWGLMHDAAEALVGPGFGGGDVPTPVKRRCPALEELEDAVLRAVAGRFGLPWPVPDEVWRSDKRALRAEVDAYFGRHADEIAPGHEPATAFPLRPAWGRRRSRAEFLTAAVSLGIR